MSVSMLCTVAYMLDGLKNLVHAALETFDACHGLVAMPLVLLDLTRQSPF